MNQRKWRTLYRSLVLTVFALGFVVGEVMAAPPRAHHLYISGSTPGPNPPFAGTAAMKRSSVLRVYYTYADPDGNPESGTTFQWYRYDDNFGTNKTAIPGATAATYTLNAAEEGKHISVEVRPRDNTGSFGPIVEFRPWNAGRPNPVYIFNANCFTPSGVGVPTPGNLILNPGNICSPRSLDWQVDYTGINYRVGLPPKIIIDWADGLVETLDPSLVNPLLTQADTFDLVNMSNQKWRVTRNHIYNYGGGSTPSTTPGEICTYTMRTTWGFGTNPCTAVGVQQQKFTVWDNEANTNLGQVDMNHDPSSAGVPTGEIVDLCQGDTNPVRLLDATDFNCTPAGAIVENPNPNNAARWVQFVYGTASNITAPGGAGGSIIIGGVSYSSAQLPVYGRPQYLPSPTLAPSSVTDNVQMPSTAVAGQTFVITMRTWNTCAPFDVNLFDANGLNPPQGAPFNVFNIYGPPGSILPPSLGGPPFFANAVPALRTHTIRIITTPPAPTVSNTIFCEAQASGTYNLTFAGAAGTYRVYSDPGLTTLLHTDNTAPYTYNPVTQGPAASRIDVNPPPANPSSYTRYVTVTPANNCTSPPLAFVIDINAPKTGGTITHPLGASPRNICSGTNPAAFVNAVSAGGGNGIAGDDIYQWQSSPDGSSWVNIGGATGATYDPPALFATTYYQRRVRESFYDITGNCDEAFSNVYQFIIDTPVNGGTIGNPQTVCNGITNPGVITNVTAGSGGNGTPSYSWQFSTDNFGADINTIGGATSPSYDPPSPLTVTTYFRRVNTSGTCIPPSAFSNVITITVNDAVIPGVINNPQTICSGQDPAILGQTTPPSGGDGSNYTFLWEQSATGGGVGFAAAAGTNNGPTYDPPVLTSTTFYRRRVTSGVCADAFSNEIQVTVNALPTANVAGGGSVCAGNPAPDVVFTFTGNGPWDLIYRIDGVNQPIVNNTTSPYTISNPGVGTYTIFSVTDNNAPTCTVTDPSPNITGSATVIISPTLPPVLESFTVTAPVCDDGGATNPPDAILNLLPDSPEAYDITWNINGNVFVQNGLLSDAAGQLTLSPPYTAWGSVPGSYVVTVTALKNTATGCAGAVPFSSPALVVNPRPAIPANPINAVACSTDATGAMIRVNDPGAGNLIQWYTDVPGTIAAVGATGGTRQEQFTPTSNATQTYYAYTVSQTGPTNCRSTSGTAVQHTQDLNPTAAANFPDFATCNTTATLTATPADNGGTGLWTIGSAVYYESFPSSDNGMGITGPNPHAVSFTHPANNWSITLPNANIFTAGTDWLIVDNGRISARDVNGTEVVWQSKVINLTGSVDISADIAETGAQAAGDYIRVYYKINGGAETQFGAIVGNGSDGVFQTVSAAGIGAAGNTLQIVMRAVNNGGTDEHWLDNIRVSTAGTVLPVISDPSDPSSMVSNLQVGANTFTWTISSALGACAPTNDQVIITRHALPAALDPLPALCEDSFGSADATVTAAYLASAAITDGVTGIPGSANRTVQFFTDPGRTIVVPDPYLVSDTDIIYTRVTRTDVTPMCTNDGTITFTVNPLPEAVDQDATNPETVYCENFPVGSGIADNVNLTILEDNIINGGAPRAVAWFESDMVTPVATPNDIDGVVDGRTFFARVTNTLTSCINFAQVEITVNPLPLDNPIETPSGSKPASYTVCAGTSILLFQVDPALNSGSTYNWVIPTGPGQFVKFGGGNPGDFFVLLQFPNSVASPGLPITVQETSADGCVGNVNSMNIIVDNAPPAPVIVGDNNVCANEQNVNYTISSPVGGSTYTWNVPGSLGAIVSGQGTSSIIVNMSSTSGNITVTETNANSCVSPPAAPFNVTVNARPTMTSLNSRDICSGTLVSTAHTLTASIVGSVFDWVVVGKVGPVGGASVGNTGSGQINQTLTNTSSGVGQVIYDVTPKIDIDPGPGFEYCNGPTQSLTINVYPQPVGQNHAINICSDVPLVYDIQTANINTFGNSLPSVFTYTVVSSDPGNVPAEADRVAFSNAPINHTYTNTTTSNVTVTYTITPRFDAPQACMGANFTLTVTVRPEPVGANDIKTICSGANVAYDLAANITGMGNGLTVGTTYSWVAAPNANVGGESTIAQSGSNITDVLTNFTLGNEDVIYTVTPSSSLGCAGNPFTITVTVQPAPVGSNSAATACSDTPLGINLTTSGTAVAAATYNIATNANGLTQSAGTVSAGAGRAANELADDAWTNTGLNPVNVVYTITPVSAAGCLGANFTVTVTVDPEPVGANSAVTRCSDVAVNVNLTTSAASVAAATYNIATNPNGLTQSGGTVSAGNGKAANELVDDIWENTGLIPVDVVYTVTPVSAAGCLGNPFTVTATIRPEPVGTNSTSGFCSDQVLGTTITTNGTSVAAATFNIVVNPNGLIQSAGTSSAGNGKLANEIADDAWRNVGLAPVNVVYTITPISAAGCVGNDFTITSTINPEPVGSNSSVTKCNNEALAVNLTTSGTAVAAATYNIAVNPNGLTQGGGTASAGAGKLANEIADDQWLNTGLTSVDVVYTITPVSAAPESCQGDPFTVTATINPAPVGSNSAATRCSDVAVGINLTTSGASVAASSYNIAVAPNGLTLSAGTASAGTGKGSNEIADDVWRNTGLNPVDVVYTIVPVSAAGCQGAAFTVTITVNPEPVGIPNTITRCSDDVVGINITTTAGSVAADNFTIAVNANGLTLSGGTASGGAGKAATEIADDVWRNTGLNPVNVVYTITPVSLAPCSGDPFTITVTVNPEPVGSNSNITRCSDAAVAVNLSTSGFSVAASDYDIAVNPNGLTQVAGTPSAGAGKAANEIADDVWRNTGPASVNVVYTVTPNSGAPCSGDPFTVTVTVDPEPVLSPTLNGTVCSDNIVNLTLATNGTSVGASGYNILSRTVHPSLTPVAQVVVPNNGVSATYLRNEIYRNVTNTPRTVTYDVVPVGSINGCLGDMVTVTITVDPEPVISTTLNATVCSDDVVNLVLATNGTSIGALDYNIVSRTVAPGLTPITQVVVPNGNVAANYLQNEVYRNTTAGSLTVQYVVEATGTINNCLGDQRTITITVAPEPVISTTLDASVCSDNTVGLVLNTNGTSVAAANYNIVSRTVDPGLTPVTQVAVSANNVAANYLQNEVYRNTTLGPLPVQYVVEATGTINGCVGDQRTITITINPEPVGSNSAASFCSDQVIGINLTTSGTAVAAATYNIAVNPNGLTMSAGTSSAGNGKLANELADDVWRNTGLSPVNVIYTITPVSAAPESCLGDPFTFTATINPEPVGSNSVATVCSDVPVGVTLTTSGTAVAAATYNIAVNPNGLVQGGGTASAGAGKLANEIADDEWTNTGLAPVNVVYTITPVSAAPESCQGDPFTITVTVNPEPVGNNSAVTRCSDAAVGVTLTTNAGSVAASSYNITVTPNGLTLSAGTPSAGNGKAANEIADDVWRNTGLNPVDVVYTIVPVSAAACQGNAFTVTVTVDPEPVGIPNTITRCSDDVVGINITTTAGSVAADNFTIAVNANGLTLSGGTASGGAGKAATEIADDIWRNTGLNAVNVVYTITPMSLAGCAGDPFTITVTVNPEPVGSNSTITRCSDAAVAVNLTTSGFSVAATDYDIAVNANGLTQIAGTPSAGTGKAANEIADDVWHNEGPASVNVVYTVTPNSGVPCSGDPFTVTVTVDPEPVLSPTLNGTVCSNSIVNLTLATNGASVGASGYNILSRTVHPSLTPVAQVVVPNNGVSATYLRNEIYRNVTNTPRTVTYDVVPVGSINGCLGDVVTVTITVDPEPVISTTLNATVCSDDVVNLVLATNGTSIGALDYNIVSRTVAPGLTPITQVVVPNGNVAANYLQNEVYRNTTAGSLTVQYVVEATGTINNCLGAQRTITITVAPEPVVATTLNASVCSDNIVNLVLNTNGTSVAAANYDIVSRVVDPGLTPVSQVAVPAMGVAANYLQNEMYRNTTSGSLTVEYVVEPTGTINACKGDQRTITITVDPEPVISPTLNASVCSDNAVNLVLNTVGTSVAAANYNIVSRTVAPGLTPVSQVLAPTNNVAANYLQNEIYRNTTNGSLTVQYVVEARGTINNCLGDQVTVTITIDPEPVVATTLNGSVCSDANVGLVLNTNGTSVGAANYNIVSRTVAGALTPITQVAVPAVGVANNYLQTEVYRNTTNNSLTVQYVVEALGTINGCLGDQRTITMTIDPEPVISPTLDASVCSDNAVGLVLNTNGTSVSASNYNIVSRSVTPGLTPVTQAVVPANAVIATYLQNEVYTNTTNGSLTVQYVVEARGNINGCLGDQETITITIDPEPVISPALNLTVCSDDPTGLVLNTNGTSVAAANYNIVSRIVPGALSPVTQVAVPATGVAANYLQGEIYRNTTNGSLTVQYVVAARGTINNCLGDQRTINVTIDPEPVISATLNKTVCSNNNVNLVLNTNGTSVGAASYEVITRTVAGGLTPITQVAVPAIGVGAAYLQNEVYENTTSASLTVEYVVRALGTINGCAGDNRTITITVDPEPVISPALNASVCSDNIVNLVLNTNGTSISAMNYNVTTRTVAPGLIPVTQVAVPATGVLPTYLQNEVYRNTTAGSLTVEYVVEAVGAINGCLGSQRTITITVDPEPVVSTALNATVCSDDIVGLVLNTNGTSIAAANYNIVNRIVAGGLTPITQVAVPANGVANNYLQNEVYRNTTNGSLTVQYVVNGVGTINGCLGDQQTIVITIAPEPVIATTLDKSVCSDIATNLTLNTNGTSVAALNYEILTRTVDPGLTPINQVAVPASGVAPTYLQSEIYQNTGNIPLNVVYDVQATGTINGCLSDVRTITITINPEPVMSPALDIAGVCSTLPIGLVLNTNGTSVGAASYNIQTITVPGGLTPGGANVPVPANGVAANYLANHTFRNTGAVPLNVIYRVVPVSGAACLGDFIDITVAIDPEPVVDPALSTTVCSDIVSGIVLNTNGASVAATNYDITLISQEAGLVGVPTTGPGLAPNAIQNDVFNNTTAGPLKVTYEVTPRSAIGCVGQPVQIVLTVRPEPVLNPSLDITRCSDADFNVALATNGTSVPAASFNITNIVVDPGLNARAGNVDPLGTPYNGVGATFLAGDSFENPTSGDLDVQYTVVPVSLQGCLGDPVVVTFTVQPEPVLDPTLSPAPVCSDVNSGVTLGVAAGSVAAASYNINNIIRQPGLVAGGSNASIGLAQPANAIFNDVFTNTTAGVLTVTYKIVPVSAAGCLGDEADVVFTIQPSPAMANTLNKTVCTTEISGIIFATSGSSAPAASYNIVGVAIQPGLTQTAGNTGVRMGVTANEIQNDRFQNPGNTPLTVTYSVQGVTAAACIGPVKDIVLTVEPTITATPVNTNTDICSATATDIELLSPTTATSGNITFNYTAVSSIGGQMTGFVPALNNLPLGYRITDNLVNNSNSTAFVTYSITPVANGAKNGAGCIGPAVVEIVNVEPKPKLTASPLVQTICESDGVNSSPTNILLTTPTNPSAGSMEFSVISRVATGGASLLSPVKNTYLNGESITDEWSNPTLTDQTVTYTLRPQVNGGLGCPGDDVTVNVTIKPRPVISAVADQTVCSGEYRNIPLTMDIAGTFATWTVVAPPTITGALNGGGNSMDLTLFNSGFNVETVTYTVTPKFNNCNGIPITFNVTVNPTPNITGIPATTPTVCNGDVLNIPLGSNVPGTTFDLAVTDVFNLEAPGFFDRTGVTGINQLVNNPTGFQAILIYQITPISPAGCVGIPKILNVNVGSIIPNVTPDQTEICSGGRIQMTNSSLGATSHRWFYRVQGTTTELDVRTTPFVNYQLNNTSTTNPIVYEIVYQPSNGLCTVPDVVTPITVYRNVVAGFNEGTVPPIIAGTSTVNFTNTSNPVDAQFRYEWNFGSASSPATFTGATPPPVVYSQQGQHVVTLKAINIAAETAGKACENTFTKTIFVPILPLVADFTLDPPAACFPATVKVIANPSTGDINEWRVVNSNGQQVAVSGENLPEFFISTPGLFTVQLTTKDSFTGQVEFATKQFEIYSNPVASFQARPTTVFVPDTEMSTFNFSTGANFYSWDFGDGETSDEREPKHIYKIEGVYDIVMVAGFEHDDGVVCTDTLTQKVAAKQGGQTKVPNAFTPNPGGPSGGLTGGGGGGTFNDVFLPIVKGVEEFNMQIFDRWGNLIFESNNANVGWDGYDRNGNILPSGVYVYKLTLRLSDGQRTTQIGDITMIR